MNNRNTVGKLTWVVNTEICEPTPPINKRGLVQYAEAATGVMTDFQPGAAVGSGKPLAGVKPGWKNPFSSLANELTKGEVAQYYVGREILRLEHQLTVPTTPPLTSEEIAIYEGAIEDIKTNDLPVGDVESAEAKADNAIDQVFVSQIARAGATAGNVRVSGQAKSECDELCELACQCMNGGRVGNEKNQECVARKLREKYYDKAGPKYKDGSPRRPQSATGDGPRPEASYDPNNSYAPVESATDPACIPVRFR